MNLNSQNTEPHVFIDIDGCLATTRQYYSNKKHWHPTFECYRFDEKCVRVFNEITDEINPVLILSSDWKYHYRLEQINEIFEWNGVHSRISDFTQSSWGVEFKSFQQLEECRAYEILQYVINHNVQNYVAIDDLDLKQWIPDNFVCCPRANEGIKQLGIKEKILEILTQ